MVWYILQILQRSRFQELFKPNENLAKVGNNKHYLAIWREKYS